MKCGLCGRRWPDFLEEEIQEYIEHETKDNIERGMSPEEALAAAKRKFQFVSAELDCRSRASACVDWNLWRNRVFGRATHT